MVLMVCEKKSEMNAMGTCSRCECVCLFCGSFMSEGLFFIDICQTFFTVTFKFLSVHFGLFPPSSLSKSLAICCFSEGLYCNYRSVRSGIRSLSPTHLCHSPCWAFVFSTNPTVCTQLYLRAMDDSIHPELFGCREQSSPEKT